MKAPDYAPSVGISNQPLSYQRPVDMSALEQGVGQIGDAIASVGEQYQKEQDRAARFKALVDLSNLQTSMTDQAQELWRNSKPGSTDLLPQVNKMVDTVSQPMLNDLPDNIRPEFEYRINSLRNALHEKTIEYQYKQNDEFYKAGSEAEFLKSQISLQNDPSPENLKQQQAKVENFIRSRPLPATDQESMIQTANAGLQGISLLHEKQNQAWAGGPEQVGPKISGLDEYLTRTRQIESGNNPNAKNPRSSARGRYQLLDSTRAQLGLSANPTAAEEDAAVGQMAMRDKAALQSKLGREVSWGELYLAHQQGTGGATALLQNPAQNAIQVLIDAGVKPEIARQSVLNNGGSASMSAGEFAQKQVNLFERKRGGGVGLASTDTNPLYKDVPFDQRLQIDKAISENLRTQLAQSRPDELTSLEVNGRWDGVPPSRQAFDLAYGDKAQSEWDQYQKGKETALAVHNYQSMSNDEINTDLQSAHTAIGTGPGSATAAASYAARQEAATKVFALRNSAPGDAAYQTAAVKADWDNLKLNDPDAVASAVMLTLDKQAQLGIPANKRQPFPTHIADRLAQDFADPTKPVESRAQAFFRAIGMTNDPLQQIQIGRQLIESGKLPANTEAAILAAQRGDKQGTLNLFASAMAKKDDNPIYDTSQKAIDEKKARIQQFLMDNLRATDSLGDIYYGLYSGDPANADRAQRDVELLEMDVRRRMSAFHEDEKTAERGALTDLFGDVTPLHRTLPGGGNVGILVPNGQSAAPLVAGFDNLRPQVRAVVEANTRGQYEQQLSTLDPAQRDVQRPLANFNSEVAVNDIMQGTFREIGNSRTYGWWDPIKHGFVADGAGNLVKFSLNEVVKAGSQTFDQNPIPFNRDQGSAAPVYLPGMPNNPLAPLGVGK